ncbi:hypothetical protein C2W62_28380 [Candidatus Entotheonella serta]|nr:hypothetical protein C2W62_28380 [Candidatus Entotheonella serta]
MIGRGKADRRGSHGLLRELGVIKARPVDVRAPFAQIDFVGKLRDIVEVEVGAFVTFMFTCTIGVSACTKVFL